MHSAGGQRDDPVPAHSFTLATTCSIRASLAFRLNTQSLTQKRQDKNSKRKIVLRTLGQKSRKNWLRIGGKLAFKIRGKLAFKIRGKLAFKIRGKLAFKIRRKLV